MKVTVFFLALLILQAVAQTNLFINGNFNQTAIPGGESEVTTSKIAGWNVWAYLSIGDTFTITKASQVNPNWEKGVQALYAKSDADDNVVLYQQFNLPRQLRTYTFSYRFSSQTAEVGTSSVIFSPDLSGEKISTFGTDFQGSEVYTANTTFQWQGMLYIAIRTKSYEDFLMTDFQLVRVVTNPIRNGGNSGQTKNAVNSTSNTTTNTTPNGSNITPVNTSNSTVNSK